MTMFITINDKHLAYVEGDHGYTNPGNYTHSSPSVRVGDYIASRHLDMEDPELEKALTFLGFTDALHLLTTLKKIEHELSKHNDENAAFASVASTMRMQYSAMRGAFQDRLKDIATKGKEAMQKSIEAASQLKKAAPLKELEILPEDDVEDGQAVKPKGMNMRDRVTTDEVEAATAPLARASLLTMDVPLRELTMRDFLAGVEVDDDDEFMNQPYSLAPELLEDRPTVLERFASVVDSTTSRLRSTMASIL